MAHIKLLDPFKKELRDMVVYTLAEFGATSVKRFKAGGICNPPTLFLCFIYYPFPLITSNTFPR